MGVNIGFEQDGTGKNFDRPVLVIKGFNKNTFFAVALTGKKREGKFYYYLGKIDGRDSSAILSQVRVIDSKRLISKVGVVNQTTFDKVRVALQKVLLG